MKLFSGIYGIRTLNLWSATAGVVSEVWFLDNSQLAKILMGKCDRFKAIVEFTDIPLEPPQKNVTND